MQLLKLESKFMLITYEIIKIIKLLMIQVLKLFFYY
jgi:hypothetical protein